MQQPPRRRKKRRLKPLRRLLLIAVLFLLLYGVFSLGRAAYRVVFVPRLKYAAVQAVDQSFYSGKVVVVRDELVIAAPKGGVVNILVEPTSKVLAGQPLFELVDQSLLSSIDKQLQDEAAKIAGKSAQTDDAIQYKRDQLASALDSVRELSQRYASLLNQKSLNEAKRVFKELESAQKTADKVRQEYDYVARSQEQYEAKRQELLTQRSLAITSIPAPLSGVISYRTDGFENKLKATDLNSITLALLRSVKAGPTHVANGGKLNAGQAVATVIHDGYINLVFEAKSLSELSGSVEVVFAGDALAAEVISTTPTSEEGVHIVALRVNSPPPSLVVERTPQISLRAKGETLVSIPKAALWEANAKAYVYVLAGDGQHIMKEVFLRQTSGNSLIVAGLNLGETVVTNPKLIQEKEASE